MATYTLGQAAYVNKGAYNSGTAYAPLNTVYYNGGTWVALVSVTGVTPGSDNTKWLPITKGIKTATIAESSGNALVTITFTDGTTTTATIPLTTVADGTITVAKLASGFSLPASMGGTGLTGGAQAPIQVDDTGTLYSGSWVSNKQSITVTGLQTTSKFIAQPDTKAGWIAAQNATIYPPEITAADTLTFECASVPTADIHILVYWW